MEIQRSQLVSDLEDDSLCFDWIDDMTGDDIKDIQEYGCGGSYAPAVTYHTALSAMNEHDISIFDFIESYHEIKDIPPPDCITWPSLAVHYLTIAVHTWAGLFEVVEDIEDDEEE